MFDKKNLLVCILSFVIIAIFLCCGFYAVPSADDYIYANLAKESGLLDVQIRHYFDWSGRYFATFIITLFSLTGYEKYWLTPWFCILSLSVFFYFFLLTLFAEIEDKISIETMTIAFIALFLSLVSG